MARALGDPQYDPHGAPIPTAAGEIEEAELVTLADAAVGVLLELRQVGDEDPARLRYLAEQGLTPGTRVTVRERQPFNGPTIVTLAASGEARVVGQELARSLWCRVVAGGRPRATAPAELRAEPGWRHPRLAPSLAEVYRTVPIREGPWWRKALAFAGPGYLVAVGYMDPGNWATDLAGGSRFGYALLSVILLSNLMAILLQGLSSKLGIVTGRDLAQACRDHYSKPTAVFLWVICEIAIAACDLAEVIGSAIALNLLFGIPLPWGIAITALDVLIVLFLQHKGFRLLEALVVALIGTIARCFPLQ